MSAIHPMLLGVALLLWVPQSVTSGSADLARLQQVLHDKQDSRNQSQAALLLVQNPNPEAEEIVRQGLRQPGEEEIFLALVAALRLTHDTRFGDDLGAPLAPPDHPNIGALALGGQMDLLVATPDQYQFASVFSDPSLPTLHLPKRRAIGSIASVNKWRPTSTHSSPKSARALRHDSALSTHRRTHDLIG